MYLLDRIKWILIFFLLIANGNVLVSQVDTLAVPFCKHDIKIDGNLQDWDTYDFNKFFISNDSLVIMDSIEVALCWNKHFLSCAFKSNDSVLSKCEEGEKNTYIWRNDSVEVYIDPKDDSDTIMDMNDLNCIVDFTGDYTIYTVTEERIKNPLIIVPKKNNKVEFYFERATNYRGTINDNTDTDKGFDIEIKIPWAPMGVLPNTNDIMRIDVCLNDLDQLTSPSDWRTWVKVPPKFYVGSWTGEKDFGYPLKWQPVRLIGQENPIKLFINQNFWCVILAVFFLGLLFVLLLVYQRSVNYKLRRIIQKSKIQNENFKQLLAQKNNLPKAPLSEKVVQPKIFEEAKIIMEQHLEENMRPTDLAKELNISLRKLQRLCKTHLETTPSVFITLYKVEKAAELLSTTNLSISDVAYRVGFSDPSYFSKVFKKYFNEAPMSYQKTQH